MRKTLLPLLLTLLLLSLAACGNGKPDETKSTEPKETTSVSKYESYGDYVQIAEPLSWEQINAFPIKSADMTVAEARQLVVDFFRFAKTARWTPDSDMKFIRNASGSEDELGKGLIYGGLPYVGVGSGNVYRLLDYMDPETGVVDIKNAVNEEQPYDGWKVFGNQCSIGAWWGWARVINSAGYRWTQDCMVSRKMPRVGTYVYDDTLDRLRESYGTNHILKENGQKTMFESYAELQVGDGLVNYTTAGHVVMCASTAHVEYKADGSIDPDASFITIVDQGQLWEDKTDENGETFRYKGGVDTKMTFTKLWKGDYMPFTFLEFLGHDPFEDTEVGFSFKEDTLTVAQLFTAQVTSNYSISDIYAIVYDEDGNEIYKHAVRAMQASVKKMTLIRAVKEGATVNNVETWGELVLAPNRTYRVDVVAQLGTGERPTVYSGTLIAE